MNGSIRSKNSWELTIDLGRDAHGKRCRKFKAVQGTKAQAQQKLREMLTSLDKGVAPDSSKITMGEYLHRWLTDYAETHTSPRTVMGYKEKVRNYLQPQLGHLPLVKVTPQHVQNLYSQMLARGLSPRTALITHRILRESLKHAVKLGLLVRNVCDAVDPPKPQRKEMAALDTNSVQRFLDVAVDSRYGKVFFLALYSGLRRSELLGLRWSAIDLRAKTISVTETLQRIQGKGLVALQPKTARSRRVLSIPESAVALLGGMRSKQIEERSALGLEWSESEYVFARPDGRPFNPEKVSQAFNQLIKQSGLPLLAEGVGFEPTNP